MADPLVVQVAAQKALAQQEHGKLITKSLHAELVYNMSGSRHVSCLHDGCITHMLQSHIIHSCFLQISESFNRFGVTDSSQHLLVARFDGEPAQVGAGQSFCFMLHHLLFARGHDQAPRNTAVCVHRSLKQLVLRFLAPHSHLTS